ncbi:MAG: winged helix-turn-helix transcriptional regulator [Mesorhizobium sp.]|nr:MAG: HxlR family transcriptional regulator [Mesorhizobium sp.]TIO25098.1 MAG: winged helix-turn-helix transcriptional regulator [Mesorhizobium sp.]TJV57884.1 MAG: winged helix-turn-helix transcriptional regulator [Mesorhizobium sp.]
MAFVRDRHAVYDHHAQECTYTAHSVEKDTVMPRIRHERFDCSPGCTVEGTLRYIDGKWKGVVLYHLFEGTLRFNEIRRRIPNCTQRMLTNQLRELEADGLIARKIYPQVPPKVEYSLTPRGRSLEPVITALKTWGDANAALGPQTSQAAA